jgi:hypothetical protein
LRAGWTFELRAPAHGGRIRNLATRKAVAPGSVARVGPRTTLVLHLD